MSSNLDPQQFLLDSDLGYAPELRRWLEDELNVSPADVQGLEIKRDMLEVSLDTDWMSYIPGNFMHFLFLLHDGRHAYKTIRIKAQCEQEEEGQS